MLSKIYCFALSDRKKFTIVLIDQKCLVAIKLEKSHQSIKRFFFFDRLLSPHLFRQGLCFLPLQDLYSNALDQELENQRAYVANYTLVLGHKFVEPLNSRRLEHEKARKSIKTIWARENKRLQDALSNLRKARDCYNVRRTELQRVRQTLRTLLETANVGGHSSHPHSHHHSHHHPAHLSTLAVIPHIGSTGSSSSSTAAGSATVQHHSGSTSSNVVPSAVSTFGAFANHSNISSASTLLSHNVTPNMTNMSPSASGHSTFGHSSASGADASISGPTSSSALLAGACGASNISNPSLLAGVNYMYSVASGHSDSRSTSMTTCSAGAVATTSGDSSAEQLKIERKRKSEEEAVQRALEAEAAYKYAVIEANERFVFNRKRNIV